MQFVQSYSTGYNSRKTEAIIHFNLTVSGLLIMIFEYCEIGVNSINDNGEKNLLPMTRYRWTETDIIKQQL